jgi:hypothetical protein
VRRDLPDLTVSIDATPEPSSSTIATAGAYVVVLATTLPDRACGLTSCYLGELDADTAVSHLHLGPERHAELTQRVLPGGRPGLTHARTCLLDHAAELQERLADDLGETVRVEVGERTLEHAGLAWRDDRSRPEPEG